MNYKVDGGSYDGKQVSINDKSGASANIDALKSIGKDGNLVVVPEGSQPIVGTK